MANITFHNGDLIRESTVDVICHQVNCQAVMGAGIAKQIRDTYPRVYGEYVRLTRQYRAQGLSPLGKCQLVYADSTKTRIVANLFGQEFYGRSRQQTDYKALEAALLSLSKKKILIEANATIGFPYLMGCALGGGDWTVVFPMIRDAFVDYPGAIEIWKL